MSTYPRLEARVSALERRQTHLEVRIEEVTEDITTSFKQLSEDMTASFKQLSEYLIKTEERTEERFDKIEADITNIKATMATKEDLTRMATKEDLTRMATKEDLAAMETRILGVFKQLLTTTNLQQPPSQ